MPLDNDENDKFYLKDIPAPVSDILRRLSVVKNMKKRTPVFTKDDDAGSLYIVIDGWVKLYNVTEDGQEIVLKMLTAGDVFGTSCIFNSSVQFYTAEAFADTQLLEVDSKVLRQYLYKSVPLSEWLMSVMDAEVQSLLVKNGQMASMSAPQRLGCLLLRLSSWMVGTGGTFSLPYGKSVAAAQLGVNPATFSRILFRLQEHGVYVNGSEVHIQSFARLSDFCCAQCPLCTRQCAGRRMWEEGAGAVPCRKVNSR